MILMLVSCEADTQGRLDERRVRMCSTVVSKLQALVYRHASVAVPLLGHAGVAGPSGRLPGRKN